MTLGKFERKMTIVAIALGFCDLGCSSDTTDRSTTTQEGHASATGNNGAAGNSNDNHLGPSATPGAGGQASTYPCPSGLAGTWKLPEYEAYLVIDSECQVPLFCDLVAGHHTIGFVDGNTLILNDLATLTFTLEGDTLTLLDAGSGNEDLPFARQSSAVVPAACQP